MSGLAEILLDEGFTVSGSDSHETELTDRLEAKGAVTHDEGGRAKRYAPLLRREEAARAETENFLSKVYGGSLGLMMSAMAQSKSLTEEDIAELSAILERAGGAQK